MPVHPDVEAAVRDHIAGGRLADAATLAVRSYGAEVFSFLASMSQSEADAREIFSQLTEDLWRGLPAFRGDASLRTWMYVLARHAAHRFRRDPYRRRAGSLSAGGVSQIEQVSRDVTRTVDRTEVKDGLARLRASLSPDDRTLLILRVDRGLSFREIAQILGETGDAAAVARREVALRKRFERVKAGLRARAEADGLLRKKT